jgi:hypothetical protein
MSLKLERVVLVAAAQKQCEVCGTKGADRGDPHELCEMYRFVDGTGAKVTCCFDCRWRVTTADTVAEVARDLGVLK